MNNKMRGWLLTAQSSKCHKSQTFSIKDKINWGFCRTNFSWRVYQIDDIELSQGETIPALRMSLPGHGQAPELGERIETCPQENVVFKIILQMYEGVKNGEKKGWQTHVNWSTSEIITFHWINLHKHEKNHFPSHLAQVWGLQLFYCFTFMTKLYNTALGRHEEQQLRPEVICIMEIKSNSNGYFSGNSTQISIGQFGKL